MTLHQSTYRLFLMVAVLYIIHALPLYFFNVALPAILRQQGVDIRVIGMLSLLYLPWAFKFLWASYVDNHYLAKLGKRKTWLFFTQIVVVVGLFCLSFLSFDTLILFLAVSFLVSLASATQDIAIDGYTVEQFDKSQFGLASAMQSFGVAFGSMVGGAGTLWLYQLFGWQSAVIGLASLIGVVSWSLWLLKDNKSPTNQKSTQTPKASLTTLIKHPTTKWLLLLIVAFRFVEAPIIAMLNPMLVDFGFSLSQIGVLFSVLGAIVGIGSALLAGLVSKKISTVRCLLLSGWIRTGVYGLLSLCLFYPLAGEWLPALGSLQTGFMTLLAISVLLILAIRYLTMTSLYALFMHITNPSQAGTDFTLFVCVELLVYFIGGAMSGFLVHQFGYDKLILWLTIGSGVSMLILPILIKKLSITDF